MKSFREQVQEIYPNEVYQSQEIDAYKNLIRLIIFLITFSIIFGTVHILKGGELTPAMVQYTTALVLLVCLVIGYWQNKPKKLSWVVFLVAYTHLPIKYISQGTLLCSTPLWYVLAPLLSVYFIGAKGGFYALILGYIEIFAIAFYFKGALNIFDPNIYSHLEVIMLLSVLAVPFLTTLLLVSYSKSVEKWKNLVLKKFNDDFYQAQFKSLGEMAGNMAHEINNPLAIIKGNSDYLIKKIETIPYDLEKETSKIRAVSFSADRISKIVRTLLQISRRESVPQIIEEVRFKEVYDIFYPLIEQKLFEQDIDFKVKLETLDFKLKVNKEPLAHVLYNLCMNSIAALQSVENPVIEIVIIKVGDNYVIQVIDSGIGIDTSIKDRIMEPFFTTMEDQINVGLGLSLSKTIIESIGGSIDFSSEKGRTTFSLKIPELVL
ncbi:MAG: HAMP domain-containing histidine kinase [Oligoflexia bacterium]|nr:HAMP domain-containing histidine kinase [Oligoflexia bacterium]